MCQFPLSKSVKLPHSLVDGLVCWFDSIFELLLPVVICAVSPCKINGQASGQYRCQIFLCVLKIAQWKSPEFTLYLVAWTPWSFLPLYYLSWSCPVG